MNRIKYYLVLNRDDKFHFNALQLKFQQKNLITINEIASNIYVKSNLAVSSKLK